MHKFLNFILIFTLLVSGFVVYSLEHATRGLERDIARLKREIGEETENMRLLNAEWSSLTRPDRLHALAEQHLGLSTLKAGQIVKFEDIVNHVPPEPIIKLEAQGSDPIGAIIGELQQ
ncbi:cell division protein FtsL [Aestuariivirga sp.]|jgi:cell division protein FtsL|uniref:cell division protein FtsL n=1 Tax=Aestuariivirga sp. TaxID=2650926 RepID=UPI003782F63E